MVTYCMILYIYVCVCVCVCVYIYIYEMSRIGKSVDTDSWMVVARDWEEGTVKRDSLMGSGFPVGVMKMFWNLIEVVVCTISVLNTTESYTLKWLSLCYVNFTSVKKKKVN